ncbi:MAG: PEP-CTERM sorting domain-containing protein [Myxococcota bacterium]
MLSLTTTKQTPRAHFTAALLPLRVWFVCVWFFCVLFFAAIPSASATPVLLTEDGRFVRNDYREDPGTEPGLSFQETLLPETPFAEFGRDQIPTLDEIGSRYFGSAAQFSTITPLRFAAKGIALTGTDGQFDFTSVFQVSFEVIEPTETTLMGELTNEQSGNILFRLRQEVNGQVETRITTRDPGPLDWTGVLLPGRYFLYATTSANDFSGGRGRYEFEMNFSPDRAVIPEPSSAILIALGLGWLSRRGAARKEF